MRWAFIGLLAVMLTGCTYITVHQEHYDGGEETGGASYPDVAATRLRRKVPVCLLDPCLEDLAACTSDARAGIAQRLKALGNPVTLASGPLLSGAPRALYTTISVRRGDEAWKTLWSDIGCAAPRGTDDDARRNECRRYMSQWIDALEPGFIARLEADHDFRTVCLRDTQ